MIYIAQSIRMGNMVKKELRNLIFTKLEYHLGQVINHVIRGSFYFSKRSFESYKRRTISHCRELSFWNFGTIHC